MRRARAGECAKAREAPARTDARDLGTERNRKGRFHVRNLPTDAWGGDATVSRAAGEARGVGGLKFEREHGPSCREAPPT